MAARKAAGPPKSMAPMALIVAVAAVPLGAWLALPGALLSWVALLAAAYAEPFPALTGPRKPGRGPTPAGPAEEKALRRYEVARAARLTLLPSPSWLPSKDPQASVLAGILAAAVVATLPVSEPWMRAAAALAAYAASVGPAGALRQVSESPGSTLSSLIALLRGQERVKAILGAVFCGGAALALTFLGLDLLRRSGHPGPFPALLTLAGYFLLGAGAGALPGWRSLALADYRELMDEREIWKPRWIDLKVEPEPVVVSTREVGGARASVLHASGGRSSADLLTLAPKLAPYAGSGTAFAVLPVEDETDSGPIPGTSHRLRAEAVSWPDASWPDLGDPALGEDVALLAVRFALAANMPLQGLPAATVGVIEPLHGPESGAAAWRVVLAWPLGGSATSVRIGGVGAGAITGGMLGEALLDHRDGPGVLYVGNLTDGIAEKGTADAVALLAVEDDWNAWWSTALKTTVNPPVIKHEHTATGELANGSIMHRYIFVVRLGQDPSEMMTPATERRLQSGVGHSTMLTVTGFSQGVGTRSGERHGQVLVVYRSTDRLPASIGQLAPHGRSNGPMWFIVGSLNHAFDHCRMARPEVVAVKALTKPGGRGHIWEVRLRLYGGVAFGDVRTMGERLRQALGVDWLRVADAEDGCVLYVGAKPATVALDNPKRDSERLTALDWDQAFVDAKISGAGGRVPVLLSSSTMPANDKVSILDFELPPGLDITEIRKAVPKLKTNTGNTYVEIRSTTTAGRIQVLCCPVDPMPFPAPFDYETARSSARGVWPFGVSVDGTPMCWRVADASHILVAGGTGTGKSVTVQTLLTSMAVKPAEETLFFIIDIQKKGADYRFMSDFLSGVAWTSREAAALIRAVYAIGQERIERNAELGVGNVSEWPEGPPPQLVLVVDEFTSLITTEPVSRTGFDDPEMEASRMATLADNGYRVTVGQYAGKIARELRSAGITLVLATQQLKADTLKTIPGGDTMKSSLSRMLLGRSSFGERSSALKQASEAADLGEHVPRGRGLFEGESYAVAFQSWFEPDTAALTAAIAQARSPITDPVDLARFLAPEVETGPAVVEVELDNLVPDQVMDLGDLDVSLDDFAGLDFGDNEASDGQAPAGDSEDEDDLWAQDPWGTSPEFAHGA